MVVMGTEDDIPEECYHPDQSHEYTACSYKIFFVKRDDDDWLVESLGFDSCLNDG